VIGLKEARLYFKLLGIPFDRGQASTRSFKFGSTACKSQGVMKILIPSLSPGQPSFCFSVDIVNIDVLLLIGLDVQKAEQIDVSASTKTLICRRNGSTIPLDDDGHLVLRWPIGQFKTYYTKPQLQRLHRQLLHPYSRKLYELLRRARPEDLPPETRSMIDDITRGCETCATWDRRPTTFSIRDIDDVVFNQELLIDIAYFDGLPILHVVDRGTRVSAARFLRKVDAVEVWKLSWPHGPQPTSVTRSQS
jgi:hypothetical protein